MDALSTPPSAHPDAFSVPPFHACSPEVSRDFNIGEWGSSCDNQGCKHTYDDWLSTIKLNEEPVDWAAQDLSYLEPER